MLSKNLSFAVLVCLISFISISCMQAPQKVKLWVKNDTGNEIKVTYQGRNVKNPVNVDVEPGQTNRIVHDSDDLILLKVVPYGRGKQFASVEKLTMGYVNSENLADRIREVRIQAPQKQHIILTVKLKPSMFGAAISYDYAVSAQDLDPSLETEQKVPFTFDLFPKTKAAMEAQKKVEPRYFLNLPEYATNDDIQTRYEQLMNQWEPKLPTKEKNIRDYTRSDFVAREAVKFIRAAYQALMFPQKNQQAFDKIVKAEIDAPTVLQ